MATTPVYQEPIEGDSLTKSVRSFANNLASTGQQYSDAGVKNVQAGNQQYTSGAAAAAPSLDLLTKLVRGDQADISQAIQPEANRIRDSFSAVRNMISSQPRGGGKAGALAEAPYEEVQQIGDAAQKARAGATGELGNLSTTLAGLGQGQESVGLQQEKIGETGVNDALQAELLRRNENNSNSFAAQFVQITQGLKNLI